MHEAIHGAHADTAVRAEAAAGAVLDREHAGDVWPGTGAFATPAVIEHAVINTADPRRALRAAAASTAAGRVHAVVCFPATRGVACVRADVVSRCDLCA